MQSSNWIVPTDGQYAMELSIPSASALLIHKVFISMLLEFSARGKMLKIAPEYCVAICRFVSKFPRCSEIKIAGNSKNEICISLLERKPCNPTDPRDKTVKMFTTEPERLQVQSHALRPYP